MNEQESFFLRKHDRLLSIAAWSNGLIWVVIAWFIIVGLVEFLRTSLTGQYSSFIQLLGRDPLLAARLMFGFLSSVLKGFIYALALKGISLGLNMIVETDINYRENMAGGGKK